MSLSYLASLCCAILGSALLAFAGVAHAACYAPQQQLPATIVAAFINEPGQLLWQHPRGGAQMIQQIRDLAASDPSTLPLITQLTMNASPAQKSAIGSGLAQAARVCIGTDQAFANQIQSAVAQTGDPAVITAYAAVTGERPLAGLGAGVGSLGAAGGQIQTLPGSPIATGPPQPFGQSSTPTGMFTYTSSVMGAGNSTSNGTTTVATIINSISP